MPSTDFNTFETTIAPPPPAPPDAPRTFAIVAPAVPVGIVNPTTVYSTISAMEDDGWDNSFVAYNAMVDLLAQPPAESAVSSVVVVKRAAAVKNTWSYQVLSDDNGLHTIEIEGVLAASHTAAAETFEQIRDALIADFIAGPFNTSQAATPVVTDTIQLEAVIAGVPFVPTGSAAVGLAPAIVQTLANVGIYEDLGAAYDVVQFWGVLTPGLVDDAETAEPLRWCHTDRLVRQNFYFAETNDIAGIADSGNLDNLALTWLAAGYAYANLLVHTNATEYAQAMAVGRIGGGFPGKRAWHEIALTGSAVGGLLTADQTLTMRTRRVSYTERWYGPESDLLLLGGYTPSGHFIVQRWVEAWWFYIVRAAVEAKKKSNAGVDLDNAGLAEVVLVVKQAMIPLQNEGIIAEGWTVGHTPIASVPAGQLAIGDFKTPPAGIVADVIIVPKLRALRVSLFASAV